MKGVGFINTLMDFRDLSYLKHGNYRQQAVYDVLAELQIMDRLREFDPILVGTIPIGIDLPESDLDIICCVSDFKEYQEVITERLGSISTLKFSCEPGKAEAAESLVVQFTYKDWLFELFAQPVPTVLQNGFRHMVVEHRILNILGEEARQSIISLKQSGVKTEPAFAKLLGIEGDPFQQLLLLSDWCEDELRTFLKNKIIGGLQDMNKKNQLIEQYSAWINFIKVLEEQKEDFWNQPLGEGKWSVRDVVSHIMKWDKYFFEEAIRKVSEGEELTVKHLDYNVFNEQAKQYGRTCSIQELVEQTKTYRQTLIDHIQSLSDEQYDKEYTDADGHPFQTAVFMKDFIWHDQHHMKQIQPLLNNQ